MCMPSGGIFSINRLQHNQALGLGLTCRRVHFSPQLPPCGPSSAPGIERCSFHFAIHCLGYSGKVFPGIDCSCTPKQYLQDIANQSPGHIDQPRCLAAMHRIWMGLVRMVHHAIFALYETEDPKCLLQTWRAVAIKMPSVPPQTQTSRSIFAGVRRCLTLTTFGPRLAGCSFKA